jgi:hypothetical protein
VVAPLVAQFVVVWAEQPLVLSSVEKRVPGKAPRSVQLRLEPHVVSSVV